MMTSNDGRSSAALRSIVGLGVSALDVITVVERFPTKDGVQRAHELVIAGGGPVATACVAAARLGSSAAVLDVVGDDWVGVEIGAGLQDAGIDCAHVQTVAGGRSPLASVMVERSTGDRAIAFHPGTMPLRTLDALDHRLICTSRCLHVNGRHWPSCLEAAQKARAAGTWVSFDGGAGRYRAEHRALIALADVCVVAAPYAEALTGQAEPDRQLREMQSISGGIVGVTNGRRGSWLADLDGCVFHQAAYRAPDLVDTTGCGDAYHGALLHALLDGQDLHQAANLASAVAALNANHLGGRAGLPTRSEVEQYLLVAEALP